MERLKENAGASDILLASEEVKKIDAMLEQIPMSEVFGGTKVTKQMLKMLEECPILSKHFLSAEDKHYLLFQVDIINTEFN